MTSIQEEYEDVTRPKEILLLLRSVHAQWYSSTVSSLFVLSIIKVITLPLIGTILPEHFLSAKMAPVPKRPISKKHQCDARELADEAKDT